MPCCRASIEPMQQISPPSPDTEGQRDSLSLVFVSLYFLLVAFFIFLNSISQQVEVRAQAVIGSVDAAFEGKKTREGRVSQSEDNGRDLGLLALFGKMRNVFETAIPLVEVKERQQQGLLQFAVPAGQIFDSNAATLRERHNDFLKEIVLAIRKSNTSRLYELEILMGAGGALPGSGQSADNLSFNRLNLLSKLMLYHGLPANLLSIGLTPQNSGTITFSFAPAQLVTPQHITEMK